MTDRHFTRAIVRRPANSLGAGITTQQLGPPDIALACEQHAAYVRALETLGVSVTVLDPDERYPDSTFVEDVAVLHRGVAILTKPGAGSRRGEVETIREVLAANMPVIELGGGEDVRLDGGDVLVCAHHVLVGIAQRTNHMGFKRLTQWMREIDPALTMTAIQHSGVLHLKTGMTALHKHLLLRDVLCRMEVRVPFARTIMLPREQGYGANVLPINDGVIIAKGFPMVATLAREHYAQVIELDMSEFHKMDGSLTCLSLLW